MKTLTEIKWTDNKIQEQEMHLINEMTPYWKRASDLLGLDPKRTVDIETYNHSVEVCCKKVMEQWLSEADGTYNYPRSWEGLYELLEDMELPAIAKNLRGQSKILC